MTHLAHAFVTLARPRRRVAPHRATWAARDRGSHRRPSIAAATSAARRARSRRHAAGGGHRVPTLPGVAGAWGPERSTPGSAPTALPVCRRRRNRRGRRVRRARRHPHQTGQLPGLPAHRRHPGRHRRHLTPNRLAWSRGPARHPGPPGRDGPPDSRMGYFAQASDDLGKVTPVQDRLHGDQMPAGVAVGRVQNRLFCTGLPVPRDGAVWAACQPRR